MHTIQFKSKRILICGLISSDILVCYVPATGDAAPALAWNRVGPLLAHSPRVGGRVRARSDQLQRRGASCPCSTPAIRAGV